MANHESIPRRTAADTEGDVHRILGKLEATGQNMTVLRIMANEPKLFRPFVLFANALVYSEYLPADVREVVVLWIARDEAAPYEWHEHVPMARRAGLSDEQIERVSDGRVDASGFSDDHLLGVAVARAILHDRSLPTELWEQSVERWGVEGAIDLVMSVGWWGGSTRMLLEALGLRAPDEGDHPPAPWERNAVS
jgi:alkylhydroperoxidase family enzyme